MDQITMFEFLDENLAILQEQLPFTITDCKLGYKWIEQCRMQVDITTSVGEIIPLITTLKLKIIDVHFRKGLEELLTYDTSVSPTIVYFNRRPSAYHLYSNWYAEVN